jgi:hypothetical protein
MEDESRKLIEAVEERLKSDGKKSENLFVPEKRLSSDNLAESWEEWNLDNDNEAKGLEQGTGGLMNYVLIFFALISVLFFIQYFVKTAESDKLKNKSTLLLNKIDLMPSPEVASPSSNFSGIKDNVLYHKGVPSATRPVGTLIPADVNSQQKAKEETQKKNVHNFAPNETSGGMEHNSHKNRKIIDEEQKKDNKTEKTDSNGNPILIW